MVVKENCIRIVGTFNLLLFLCLIVNEFKNTDFVALILFVSLILYTFKKKNNLFIKYAYFYIMAFYHLLSVFIVNNINTYLYNLQEYSSDIGAFVPLLLFYAIEFSMLFLLESNSKNKILKKINYLQNEEEQDNSHIIVRKKKYVKITTFFIFIILFYMLFRIVGKGYYSFGGIDRFAYRAQTFSEIDEKLYNYIIWLLPIPLLFSNFGKNKITYLFLGLVCFYYISVGDKFSSLITVFYIYLLVCWATKKIDKKLLFRIIALIVVVIFLLLIYVGYQVAFERGGDSYTLITYFQNRLTGGQSDLWWKIYKICKDGNLHISEFEDEIKAIFSQPSSSFDYNFGIYKMMRVTAPSSIVYSYLSRGARFAASTQASVYYYFNYLGLIVWGIIVALMLFGIINCAILAYKRLDIIDSICYTMLIQKTMLLTSMSDITVIGHATTILAIIVLLYRFCMRNRKSRTGLSVKGTMRR